jgi:hypothetical protein
LLLLLLLLLLSIAETTPTHKLPLSGPLGNMSLEQEEQLQQKLSNWRSGFSKDKAKVSKQKDRAEALDDAMKRIRELTGAHGIDEFIDLFLRFEETNFRSFQIHTALVAGKCLIA